MYKIIKNKPALIGKRQIQPITVVSTKSSAFGGFDFLTFTALHEGCSVQSLKEIKLNGCLFDTDNLLISLLRHSLIQTDQQTFLQDYAIALLREPTCCPTCRIVNSPLGSFAINQLNGRTIKLNDKTKPLFLQAETAMHLQHPIEETTIFFIKAGMRRLVK
ncbi:hypothetical protein [Bartonella queenslandensis]|uniref:hypothetical protein n=1 Tax=Bartonella queenslandensis TaxID=481138 RepID=UPI0002EFDB46|nr:hypothetical protein [Bartonella queenslandensis]